MKPTDGKTERRSNTTTEPTMRLRSKVWRHPLAHRDDSHGQHKTAWIKQWNFPSKRTKRTRMPVQRRDLAWGAHPNERRFPAHVKNNGRPPALVQNTGNQRNDPFLIESSCVPASFCSQTRLSPRYPHRNGWVNERQITLVKSKEFHGKGTLHAFHKDCIQQFNLFLYPIS